jgi:hypothetical protein
MKRVRELASWYVGSGKKTKREALEHVALEVGRMLHVAQIEFGGENLEESSLWKRFTKYDGQHYDELTREVRALIHQSQEKLTEALKIEKSLKQYNTNKLRDVDALITAYQHIHRLLMEANVHVGTINGIIARLVSAKTDATTLFNRVQLIRMEAQKVSLPEGLSTQDAWTAVDTLLAHAQLEAQENRWLTAFVTATEASKLLDVLTEFLPKVVETVNQYKHQFATYKILTKRGFRFGFLLEATVDAELILSNVYKNIQLGDISSARLAIKNLEDQCITTQYLIQKIAGIHEMNSQRLNTLEKEIVRVTQYRNIQVKPIWIALKKYAADNWSDIADHFDEADVQGWIEPIALQNSIEVQQFTLAETNLTIVFATIRKAERLLRAIIYRWKYIQHVERNIANSISAARYDIEQAKVRRKSSNVQVDIRVDKLIQDARRFWAKAELEMKKKSYIEAQKAIGQSRLAANAAYAAADRQAMEINGLYRQLNIEKKAAMDIMNALNIRESQMLPAAQTEQAYKVCIHANQLLQRAMLLEVYAQSMEESRLAVELQHAIAAYKESFTTAQGADVHVTYSEKSYQSEYQHAQRSIEVTAQALKNASQGVREVNSSNVGANTLRQARNMLPPVPEYGADRAALKRAIEQAQRASALVQHALQMTNKK